MPGDPYASDAEFYDLIHGSFRDDTGLWLSFAGRTDRPVLEVGCGTGRITLELARAGHVVTGIDPSPAMLAVARRKAKDDALDVEFIEGTVLDIALEADRYGLVVLPFDVFLYCIDRVEQVETLRALGQSLVFNGLLAIDLPGPALWLDADSNGQQTLAYSGATDDGQEFDCWHLHDDDLATQTRSLRVTYETADGEGLVRRRTSTHELRYVYRYELDYLLEAAGLELADVYGDYELGPLTNESERMVGIARRRDG